MLGYIHRNHIKGAIFDLDGTLLDTMEKLGRVEIEYLIALGGVPRPGLAEILRTLSTAEVTQYFKSDYGIREPLDKIYHERNRLLEDYYFHEAEPKDGAATVLENLRFLEVKMCVATATDRYLVEPAMERHGLMQYFERILTCSEENTSKSSPDIYFRAAELMGTEPGETIVIEDALYAMESAKRAGFPIIAIYDKSADDQAEEIEAISDHYFKSLVEMLEIL